MCGSLSNSTSVSLVEVVLCLTVRCTVGVCVYVSNCTVYCIVGRCGSMSNCTGVSLIGVVPKPASQVEEDGEDVGQEQHHGGIRAIRGHGAPRPAPARLHRQVRRQGHREVKRPVALRYSSAE